MKQKKIVYVSFGYMALNGELEFSKEPHSDSDLFSRSHHSLYSLFHDSSIHIISVQQIDLKVFEVHHLH